MKRLVCTCWVLWNRGRLLRIGYGPLLETEWLALSGAFVLVFMESSLPFGPTPAHFAQA